MPRVVVRHPRDLGLAIASARTARGLTQQQLADSLGLDRTYLARMETGLTTALLERLLRALRRLGAEVIVTFPDDDGSPRAAAHATDD